MSIFNNLENWLNEPSLSDFYLTYANIAFHLRAGIPLQLALKDVATSNTNQILKKSLFMVAQNLATGNNISDVFNKEKIFPRNVAPVLDAGNQSGQLAASFEKLANLAWLQSGLYSKVKNSLFVPKIAFWIMIVTIIGFCRFGLPEFAKLYQDNKMVLPTTISVTMNIVNGIIDYWPVTITVLIIIYWIYKQMLVSHSDFMDYLRLKVPIYSKLHLYFIQHQIISTLTLMLSSGLILTDALTQASKVVTNKLAAKALLKVKEDYQSGYDIYNALQKNNKNNVFDKPLISVLTAGIKSGQLVQSLQAAEEYYKRLLQDMIDPISTKATLIVMIPLGIFVITMYSFMLSPVFDFIKKAGAMM